MRTKVKCNNNQQQVGPEDDRFSAHLCVACPTLFRSDQPFLDLPTLVEPIHPFSVQQGEEHLKIEWAHIVLDQAGRHATYHVICQMDMRTTFFCQYWIKCVTIIQQYI